MSVSVQVIYGPKQQLENDWHDTYSDHAALIIPINKQHEINMLTWNILTLGSGKNNAYKKNEEPELEYKPRLTRIANALAKAVNEHNLGLILLQEVPGKVIYRDFFFEILTQLLPEWTLDPLFYQKTLPNNFGLLTLYRTHAITAIQKVAVNELAHQTNRIQIFDIIFAANTETLRLANGHFKYSENKDSRPFTLHQNMPVIEKIMHSTQNQVIIAGDFNQNLDEMFKLSDFTVYVSEQITCYSAPKNKGQLEGQKIDGFIFKYPL